jgi:hypothetical protein
MSQFNRFATLKASKDAERHLQLIAPAGQTPERRGYRAGYEHYLNKMPILHHTDELLDAKVLFTKQIVQALARELRGASWVQQHTPDAYGFTRTVIAMEPPIVGASITEGTELVIAHWGNGHTSPVHGHADGYMHEEVLTGRMRVNHYRIVDPINRVVRPYKTEIVGPGTFASRYSMPNPIPRANLVHNFTAIGDTHTLHYLPEHTREGRDNRFAVEFFDEEYNLGPEHVTQITAAQGMYLQKGEVLLVRSQNVPEYGDHYMVVTGPPVIKEHGMRVEDVAIAAPMNFLLDMFEPKLGVTLLQLNVEARAAFHAFHGITVQNNEVKFNPCNC